jgi:glycosyltransferase involved in cell wall biosynthesis
MTYILYSIPIVTPTGIKRVLAFNSWSSGAYGLPELKKIVIIGPVVWGSVWGHGPELANHLTSRFEVDWYDPLLPPGAAKSSFIDRKAYPLPDGVRVLRRTCPVRPGAVYGLCMELRNLWAVAWGGARAMVTYYPVGTLLALIWCRLTGKRSMFVYADRPDIIDSPLARRAARFGVWATAKLASAGSVATSGPLLEDLLAITPRAELIPNGVNLAKAEVITDTGRSNRENSCFTVVFAGAFGEWVDFELVLAAAASCDWARFVLIGDGPQWKRVSELAAGLDNVELTGALSHEEVFQHLAIADICLVPFAVNALTDRVCPVKLFEYWAAGRPVIGTPCRELQRLADQAPEALIIAETAEETSGLIERFRDNPDQLHTSSRHALEAVRQYDWNTLGKRFVQLLGSFMHGDDK